MSKFYPRKSRSQTDVLEQESILCIKKILRRKDVMMYFSENDKTPNIDGWIELVDEKGNLEGKISVQIKTLPSKFRTKSKYNVPSYLLGYADKMKTEVVILLVADYENRLAYWKYIDTDYINTCDQKEMQESYTYSFSDEERLTSLTADSTINIWKNIYYEKRTLISHFENHKKEQIRQSAAAFELVQTNFCGVEDSYIKRKEVEELYEWIHLDQQQNSSNIAVVVGIPGVGKSVIMKQLLLMLQKEKAPILAIKADMKSTTSPGNMALESLIETFQLLVSENKGRAILMIDQIDALSQSLTNDRYAISSFIALIKQFTSVEYPKVRIVISCRDFDLNSDPILSDLNRGKKITVELLSVEEVNLMLKRLIGNESVESISNTTIELLRNPQYLDIYCRITNRGSQNKNYATYQDLYDELWRLIVYNVDVKSLLPEKIESFIFAIGNKIHKEETLRPSWMEDACTASILSYLQTGGIISFDGYRISFLHQSFYDYVVARYYIQLNKSLFDDISNRHQGLFVRSTVKQVLAYMRDHNEKQYKKELDSFIFSNSVRYHLKLLIIQFLANQNFPYQFEMTAIQKLESINPCLFYKFLNQPLNVVWFDALIVLVKRRFLSQKVENDMDFIILQYFLASHAEERMDHVFQIIELLSDYEKQISTAEWALMYVSDYSSERISRWISKIREARQGALSRYLSCLKRAIPSNPNLVCKEVSEFLYPYILKSNEFQGHNIRFVFKELLPRLVDDYSRIIYPVLKEFLLNAVQQTRSSYFNCLDYNGFFDMIKLDDPRYKILDWIIRILSEQISIDEKWVCDEVDSLLKIEESTIYVIAFQVMSSAPKIFISRTINILENVELTSLILGSGDQRYYFRELLKLSCPFLNIEDKNWMEKSIFSFSSLADKFHDKERSRSQLLYPRFGLLKRILIYSLPEEMLSSELRKLKGELDRRFGSDLCPNEKPNHHITAASFCGGLVSQAKYNTFTRKQWLNSFYKEIKVISSKSKYRYFDERRHAEAFCTFISVTSEKNFIFVERMFSDENIKTEYKIAGLKGLLEGNFDIEECYNLYKLLLVRTENTQSTYDIIRLVKLFVKNNSKHLPEIMQYLVLIIKEPYESKYYLTDKEDNNQDDRINETLMKGVNSIQGVALENLILMEDIQSLQKDLYETLIVLYDILSVEHRMVVIHYIYCNELEDKSLFDQLLIKYLQEPIVDILAIRNETIHYYLRNKPEIVLPYIRSLIGNPRAGSLLASLLFWGVGNECQESLPLLENLILTNQEKVITQIISMSARSIQHVEYQDIATNFLNRFKSDQRKEVVWEYCSSFNSFPVDSFPLFKELFDSIILSLKSDKSGYNDGVLDYLKKCSSSYPIECFYCLKDLCNILNPDEILDNYNDNDLELLLFIYNKTTETDETAQILEEIMDTFDLMMKNPKLHRLGEMLEQVDRC